MFITMQAALAMKPFSPSMAQVTLVPSGTLVNVNVAALVEAKGLVNSSLMPICEPFSLVTMVMRPSPALSLPCHAYCRAHPRGWPLEGPLHLRIELVVG